MRQHLHQFRVSAEEQVRDLGCNYLSNILFSDVVKGGNETIWKESMNEKKQGTHT